MNTNLLLVTNVAKSLKPFDVLKELENKWARAVFVDNPYFDLMDAFVYNPTTLMTHYELGVRRLRDKVVGGIRPLKVYHLWFPPPNVYLTNLIPDNSTMLPFLFVDNLPKECDSFEIIGDLPFQPNEVKHWDVPQKEDKWMILRLPANQDDAIRDYVLKYIRSRRLSNGLFPRVLEVFATEENRLSTEMMPKKIDILPITSAYKSNLLFLYDLPTKLTVKTITDTTRTLNVKGARTFFVDVVNGLRVGFLFIPRSLSDIRFKNFQEQLKEKEIMMDNQQNMYLNINEVWLQPFGAAVPHPFNDTGDDKVVEFVLTGYIYIHNVAACIDHNQLTKDSPINFKIYLFQISENMTQIGFVCLRGLSDDKICQLVKHLRSLVFEGFQVMVDNIYLKCFDLPDNHSERRDVHIPRPTLTMDDEPIHEVAIIDYYEPENEDDNIESIEINEDSSDDVIELTSYKIEIAKEPASSYNLMKSDFIYVNRLPNDAEPSIFSYLNIGNKAISIISSEGNKAAVIYYPDTTADTWLKVLEKVATTSIKGQIMEVSEVFLQSEENSDLIQNPLPGIKPSKYLFVYNISDCSDTTKLEEHINIVQLSTMDTDSGSCAFVELVNGLTPEEIIDTLHFVRMIKLENTCLCADLIWLGGVKVVNQGDKNMRNKWLKKPVEKPRPKRMKLE